MLQRITGFLLHSRIQAMSAAFLLSFIPVIGASISILIAALVTLRKGAYEGTLVLGAALAPFLLGYIVSPPGMDDQTVMIAIAALLTINILTWLLALILRQYGNWSLVIEVAVLAGIVLIAVIHLVFPDVQGWWQAQMTAYLDKVSTLMSQVNPDGAALTEDMRTRMVASKIQYMTGFMAASIIVNALFQLVVARWWQAAIFNPGGLRKELHRIRLSYVSATGFVLIMALAYISNTWGLDMLPVIAVGFCLAGLSLIHNVLKTSTAGWFWLLVIYVGVLFVYPVGIITVALIGLMDSVFNIRQQLTLR